MSFGRYRAAAQGSSPAELPVTPAQAVAGSGAQRAAEPHLESKRYPQSHRPRPRSMRKVLSR